MGHEIHKDLVCSLLQLLLLIKIKGRNKEESVFFGLYSKGSEATNNEGFKVRNKKHEKQDMRNKESISNEKKKKQQSLALIWTD